MQLFQTTRLVVCLVLSLVLAAHCTVSATDAKYDGKYKAKFRSSSHQSTAPGPIPTLTIPYSMTKLVLESTPELQALRDGNYHWVVTEMSSQATDQPLSVLEVKHPDTMDTVAVLELPFYRLPPSSNFAAYQFVTSFKPPFFSEIVPTSANLQVELKRWFRRPIYPKLTSENIHKVHLSYNCQIVTSQMYTGFLLAIWYDEQLQQRQWSIVYNSRREKQLKPRAVQSIVASDSEIDFIFFNADDRRFKQAMKFVEDWFGTRLYGWHKAQSKRQGRRH